MDFFVVGTSRSGSTLLRHMLAAHPAVAVLNESHWLPRMWDEFGESPAPVDRLIAILAETRWDTGRRVVDVNLELAGRTWNDLDDALRRRLDSSTTIAAFHDAAVDAIFGAEPGRTRRGDKTPDYGFYMGLLQRLWPDARFVHVVRNGFDTARSMAGHSGCQLMIAAGFDNWVPLSFGRVHERYTRVDLPFDAFVGSWQRRLGRIRREAGDLRPGSYLEVRYERLVEAPVMVAGEVATHLALDADAAWLERCSSMVRPRPRIEALVPEAFRLLTVEQLRAMNDVGGVPLLAFPPDADAGHLEAALRQAAPGDEGLGVALAVLATRTAETRSALANGARRLLHEALVATGREPGAWAALGGAAEA